MLCLIPQALSRSEMTTKPSVTYLNEFSQYGQNESPTAGLSGASDSERPLEPMVISRHFIFLQHLVVFPMLEELHQTYPPVPLSLREVFLPSMTVPLLLLVACTPVLVASLILSFVSLLQAAAAQIVVIVLLLSFVVLWLFRFSHCKREFFPDIPHMILSIYCLLLKLLLYKKQETKRTIVFSLTTPRQDAYNVQCKGPSVSEVPATAGSNLTPLYG